LGIPPGTINSWASRGLLGGFEPSEGRGKARAYSTVEYLALALFRAVSDAGVTLPRQFYIFAPAAIRDWYDHAADIETIQYRFYPDDDPAIGYDDHLMAEPPRPGWVWRFSIALRPIFEPALEALEEARRELH
jgi:hypothetical protein